MLRFGTLCAALSLVVAAPSACAGRVDDGAKSEEVGSAGTGANDAGNATHDASSVVPPDASPVLDAPSTSACAAVELVHVACDDYSSEYGAAECYVDIDPYFAQPETLKFSNMRFRKYGWSDSSDQDGTLTYVGSAAACAEYPYGWYLDDSDAPTQAIACPTACACLKDDGSAFSMQLGCPRVSAPGVETPGPAPVCASSRPPKCATEYGGQFYGLLKCSKLGDGSLENVDPEQVNVAIHGTTADGYISYVPSVEDCASVTEGWYFTPGKTPPEISICPSTCACAESKQAAFEISLGCPRWSAL